MIQDLINDHFNRDATAYRQRWISGLPEWEFLGKGKLETTFQVDEVPQETMDLLFGNHSKTQGGSVASQFSVGDRVRGFASGLFATVTEIDSTFGEITVHYDTGEVFSTDPEGFELVESAATEPVEVRATDPNTGGQKGKKPEEYALIPPFALAEVARVYGMGAKKYSAHNWAKGYPYSWALSALYRHVEAFRRGESTDAESGLSHLAHATFHLFTLMEFEKHGLGTDDRWIPKGQAAQGNLGMFGEEKR
jgi:hypothetical protein